MESNILLSHSTLGHSLRVTSYFIRLCQQMGISADKISLWLRGTVFHDIGKLGIPDEILLKEGPLNFHEWEEVKKHVLYGYWMVKEIPFLAPSLAIVRNHHERFDGLGYPDQLKGLSIPLEVRIFSLCDAYDAMTTARSYRKTWSFLQARQEIINHAGTQFDPQVVASFLTIAQKDWESYEVQSIQLKVS